jgi:hypothetical protein
MASVWTSLHHEQHHAGVRHSDALPTGHATVPERLHAAGIHTAGFVANPSAGQPFGLQRGFAELHELYRSGGRFVGVPRADAFHGPARCSVPTALCRRAPAPARTGSAR